jgi:hypothetical protein
MGLEYEAKFFSSGTYTGVQAVDVDLDGNLEILAGWRDASTIEVWKVDPNGILKNAGAIGPFYYHVHDFQVADFDEDGDLDIAAGIRFGGVQYAENLGDGSWNIWTIEETYSWRIQVADFDQDGNLDILSGIDYDGGIKLFFGDGAGNFTEDAAPFFSERRGHGINVIDVNGDGWEDILGVSEACAFGEQNEIKAFLNLNSREWQEALVSPSVAFPLRDEAGGNVTAGDINGNGFIDQVTARWDATLDEVISYDVILYLGRGTDGEFSWSDEVIDTVPGKALDSGLADFNGDGPRSAYLSQRRAGAFTKEFVDLEIPSSGFHTLTVGDLNDDGCPDVTIGSEGEGL